MNNHGKSRPKGAFEQAIGVEVFGGYPEDQGPACPKCGSKKTEAVWRDAVWEETGVKCKDCGEKWIKA